MSDETNGTDIATVMRRWREKHGLTQRRAAKLWGISQAMANLIENGKRNPGSGGRRPGKYNEKRIREVCASVPAAEAPAVEVRMPVEAMPAPANEPTDSDADLLDAALEAL